MVLYIRNVGLESKDGDSMNSLGIYSNQMVNSRFHEKEALLPIKRWKP